MKNVAKKLCEIAKKLANNAINWWNDRQEWVERYDTHLLLFALLVSLWVLILSMCSCTTTKYIEVEKTKTIKEVVRDTAIVIEADTAMMQALIECDSLGNAYITEIETLKKSPKTEQKIKVVDNYIQVTAEVDSFAVYAQLKDRYQGEVNTIVKEVEKELSGWQVFRINIGNAVLVLVGLALIYIIIKAYLKR